MVGGINYDKKEAIKLINNSKYCYSLWDAEDLLEDCRFKKRQDYISYGWYTMATDIYEMEDGYIGVKGVYDLNTSLRAFAECDRHCIADEYDAVPTITYVLKK